MIDKISRIPISDYGRFYVTEDYFLVISFYRGG